MQSFLCWSNTTYTPTLCEIYNMKSLPWCYVSAIWSTSYKCTELKQRAQMSHTGREDERWGRAEQHIDTTSFQVLERWFSSMLLSPWGFLYRGNPEQRHAIQYSEEYASQTCANRHRSVYVLFYRFSPNTWVSLNRIRFSTFCTYF